MKIISVIQSLRKQAKNPPVGSAGIATRTAPPLIMGFHGLRPLNDGEFWLPRPHFLLSFRGSVATEESPCWFLLGNDDVLRCPCVGDSTACGL